MIRIKCTGQNNFNTNHFKTTITLVNFSAYDHQVDVLSALVHMPPIGIDQLVFCDGLDDPITALSKFSGDNERPASPDFALRKREKSAEATSE